MIIKTRCLTAAATGVLLWTMAMLLDTVIAFAPTRPITRTRPFSRPIFLAPNKHAIARETVRNDDLSGRLNVAPGRALPGVSLRPYAQLKRWIQAGALFIVSLFSRLKQNMQNFMWSNSLPDPKYKEPLPVGPMGCPFVGFNILKGNRRLGPEYFYRQVSQRLGNPRIFKFFSFGSPIAALTGSKLVTEVMNQEFDTLVPMGALSSKKNKEKPRVFPRDNVMFEPSKSRHARLRALIGAAMTPSKVREAVPVLYETATNSISQQLSSGSVAKMEDVASEYALQVAQTQLLGLNLTSEELPRYRDALVCWLDAMFSMWSSLNPFVQRSKPYKARVWLEGKIEEKIESLLEQGPDRSTLSNMLMYTDPETDAHLTRKEVIQNAMVLIAAGTENTASTITLIVFLLGLHPEILAKLKLEQQQARTKNQRKSLRKSLLDRDAFPYLDAVVKEALRIGPLTGGFPRRAKETVVVEGHQIPEGWYIFGNIRLTHDLDPTVAEREGDLAHMDVQTGFRPERWLDSATTPSDWIPFGAGPRYCLGANLALAEIKVFLAAFVEQVHDFELVNNSNVATHGSQRIRWNPGSMVPKPADGVVIRTG